MHELKLVVWKFPFFFFQPRGPNSEGEIDAGFFFCFRFVKNYRSMHHPIWQSRLLACFWNLSLYFLLLVGQLSDSSLAQILEA